MKLVSIAQYAKDEKVSKQAIYDRIRRGTLKPVYEKIDVMRIQVEDTKA